MKSNKWIIANYKLRIIKHLPGIDVKYFVHIIILMPWKGMCKLKLSSLNGYLIMIIYHKNIQENQCINKSYTRWYSASENRSLIILFKF